MGELPTEAELKEAEESLDRYEEKKDVRRIKDTLEISKKEKCFNTLLNLNNFYY